MTVLIKVGIHDNLYGLLLRCGTGVDIIRPILFRITDNIDGAVPEL